jgi:hypothetical protein
MLSVVLVSFALVGCSQHQGMPISEETAASDQHLPFDAASDKGGIFPTGSLTPNAIPAGTPLSVRLRTSLSSATCQPGDSFEAVLDEPVIVRGKMLAPRGAAVTGKVLDAKASGELQEPGYMRLGLISVSLNGQSLPIQTSSIFVKRGSHHDQGSTMLARSPIGGVPVDTVLISKVPIKSQSGHVSLIGASTTGGTRAVGASMPGASTISTPSGTASAMGSDPAAENTQNRDVSVSAERRLTFRLAQPLPLTL